MTHIDTRRDRQPSGAIRRLRSPDPGTEAMAAEAIDRVRSGPTSGGGVADLSAATIASDRWSSTPTSSAHARRNDYENLPPKSREEERELDERRDVHYGELNTLAAKVRIAAPPAVAQAAEDVLASVREALRCALEHAAAVGRGPASAGMATVEQRFAVDRQAFVEAIRRLR